MSRITILVFIGSLVFGCASPKYSYYFDHDKSHSKKEAKVNLQTANDFPKSSAEPVLYASTNPTYTEPTKSTLGETGHAKTNRTLSQTKAEVNEENKIGETDKPLDSKATKKASSEEGDPKKNGWAIAGFVTSIVGWFLPWPVLIVAVVFSAMGLKSQKRGLAIAGLVIGIVGLVVVLIAVASGFSAI